METRFLRTLLMVIETGSLADAARRLNVTPSAVVQRIRALEADIGHALIQRSGQATQATPSGRAILDRVTRLLEMEDDLKAAAALDMTTGRLRIGLIQTALTGMLPDLLADIRQHHPGIDISVRPGTSGDLYTAIVADDLDVAIIVEPHFALPKTIGWEPLRKEALLLIKPLQEPEADPRRLLKKGAFIRYDRQHWGGRLVDLYLQKLRIVPREIYELDSLEAITVLVSRGVGIALVPDWMRPWPEGSDVERIVLRDASTRNIGILWCKTSTRLPLVRALVDRASVVAGGMGRAA